MAEKKKYNSILISGRKDQTLTYSKYVKDEESGESVKESLDKKVNITDELTTQQIKDGAITNEKMAADSVGNTNLQDGSVSNEKLEDGSITNEKLAENSITKDKLKDNTIGVEKLDQELRQTINAATGLPKDLIETIQNVDDTLKDHQSQLDDKQSQIDDKQQQITANDEDISLLQTRSTQMEGTIKSIAATGGASQATAVTYDNEKSGLTAVNAQAAIDEVDYKLRDLATNVQINPSATDEAEKIYPKDVTFLTDNPQFIFALIDAAKNLLEGREKKTGKRISYTDEEVNGNVEVKGVLDVKGSIKSESLAKNLLEKVDKIAGKTLVDALFADGLSFVTNNPEYFICLVDKLDNIVIGIKWDGDIYYGNGVPSQIKEYIQSKLENLYSNNLFKSSNIIARKHYYAATNIDVEFDISNRDNNFIYFGVVEGDFSTRYHKYIIKQVDGENAGTIILNDYVNNFVVKCKVPYDCTKIQFILSDISERELSINIWNVYDELNPMLYVASSDNEHAHFVCDGKNDEQELSEAISLLGWNGKIQLSSGTFNIDSFINRNGIYGVMIIPEKKSINNYSDITIVGVSKNINKYGAGTKLYIRSSCFDNIPASEEVSIIGTIKQIAFGTLRVKNLRIDVEDNQHKYVIINGQYFGALVVDSCRLSGGENAYSDIIPKEGSVGIRGCIGDTNGSDYILKNTFAIALYEGFQLGGEHLVCYELGTRFCYYGYTFGHYDYGSLLNDGGVTLTKPITLINCADEGSRCLPRFFKCGIYKEENHIARQVVHFIDFNFVTISATTTAAKEDIPGQFCGKVVYNAAGIGNTSVNENPPLIYTNRTDIKFWEEGSGINFETVNLAHKQSCSTEERRKYYGNLMQKLYDTTLQKLLICVDTSTQKWVDVNGTIV